MQKPKAKVSWEIFKTLWSDLLTSISTGEYAVYFHVLQKPDHQYPGGQCPVGFARQLDEAYKKIHQNKQKFYQEYYVSIIHMGSVQENPINFLNHLSFCEKNKQLNLYLAGAKKSLMDVVQRFIYTLKPYQARLLSVYKARQGLASQPLEFIYYLINLNQRCICINHAETTRIFYQKTGCIPINKCFVWMVIMLPVMQAH